MKSKIRYILYFFSMIAGWPAVFCFMGWLPDYKINYIVLLLLSVIVAFLNFKKKLPSQIVVISIIQLITFLLYYVIFNDSSYITRCLYLVTTMLLLSIQMQQDKTEYVNTNVCWLTLQSVMAGGGFILVLLNLLPAISTFVEFDGHIGTFYGLFTVNAVYDGKLRVAGFFDEPGAFAFWGIVALLFNKLFIDNKVIEKALILGLISTLSMAYFIQLAAYFILFYHHKMSYLVKYIVLFIGVLLIISSISPEFNEAIFGRFKINVETGHLNGDNRTELAKTCIAIWKTSPLLGVGAENLIKASDSIGFVGANPFTFFATDGLIGQIVLWLPLFYLCYLGKNRKKYIFAAIVLFWGYIQRPYDPTQLLYSTTIYMMILEAYREVYLYPGINRSGMQSNKFLPLIKW